MASLRWRLVRAAGPLLSRLPAYIQLRAYARLSGEPFAAGVFDQRLVRRLAPHRFAIDLDLSDWMERFAAINGCYYEAESTALLQRVLVPGAAFLDVGGNLGFLALTAAARVGPAGRVIYVEPNARLVERFRETLACNRITNVTVHETALAEDDGEAALSTGESHGVTQLVRGTGIKTTTGDSLLKPVQQHVPLLVKIDVEGYEERVLAGMPVTLARPNTAFYLEVTDEWLRRNGGGATSLFETLTASGFGAWLCRQDVTGMHLLPIASAEGRGQCNILFARPGQFGAP